MIPTKYDPRTMAASDPDRGLYSAKLKTKNQKEKTLKTQTTKLATTKISGDGAEG